VRYKHVLLFFIFTIVNYAFLSPNSVAMASDERKSLEMMNGIFEGMSAEDFFKRYPKNTARTYRLDRNSEWLTYDKINTDPTKDTLTFHLEGGKVESWSVNDREEVVKEYISEFVSLGFNKGSSKIFKAIEGVLAKIPRQVFLSVTDRKHPVLFTEYYFEGMSRFANSSEVIVLKDDPPTFTEGVTIIKLSSELNLADSIQEVEGVILHELAHSYLRHGMNEGRDSELEKEANRLIKEWGFIVEFEKASKRFGDGKEYSYQKHNK